MTVSGAVEEFQSTLSGYVSQCESFSHLPDYQFLYKSCEHVSNNLPLDAVTSFVTDKRSALDFCITYVKPLKIYYENMEENRVTSRAKIDILSILNIFETRVLKSFLG